MHCWCERSIDMPEQLQNAEHLYLASIDSPGIVSQSRYEAGDKDHGPRMTGRIRKGGRYAVRRDGVGPQSSVVKASWKNRQVEVGDADSGVADFKVRIDGKFVPFNMDNKGKYYGDPGLYGIKQNQQHKVTIWAIDQCGNETVYEQKFTF